MLNLQGRWALVTGASRGIGRLAAIELAKNGMNIVALSRSIEHCDCLAGELTEIGVHFKMVECELADAESVKKALAEIDSFGIDIDVVLNNAGLQIGYRKNFFTTPLTDFDISFRINTIAPMIICYHFLPKMISKGFGRIVNTTSGIRLEPEQAGYSASKAALDKVTIDLGSKIEGTDVIISLTDPGWCRTDLGGPKAPNAPESAIPGVIVGAFVDDGKSGRLFTASDFYDMTLEDAVAKAELQDSPY